MLASKILTMFTVVLSPANYLVEIDLLICLKMLCMYLLVIIVHILHFKPYLSSETYSRQYKKLPNSVIHACQSNTEK